MFVNLGGSMLWKCRSTRAHPGAARCKPGVFWSSTGLMTRCISIPVTQTCRPAAPCTKVAVEDEIVGICRVHGRFEAIAVPPASAAGDGSVSVRFQE